MEEAVKRPSWIKEGIRFAGAWDPLVFRRRSGFWGLRTDEAERYEKEHSEETVKALKELGVNLLITHYHKGFGWEAEKEDIRYTKKLADLCHKCGLRAGVYIRPDTLVLETFLAEDPKAKDWIQVTHDGGHPTYGAHQTFRFKPCFNHEEYLLYLEKVIKYAIEEIGADLIHFDDLHLSPEPDSCHCNICREKFRAYLKEKYDSDDKRRERFGFVNLDHIEPPTYNLFNPPFTLEVINDPLRQEWIDFRCKIVRDTYARLASYIRKLNPEVAVETNATWLGVSGLNTAFLAGVWFPEICHIGNAVYTEEGNDPGVNEEGVLVSRIRTYKAARPLNNVVFGGSRGTTSRSDGWAPSELVKLGLAETMAYNGQTLDRLNYHHPETHPERKQYVQFYMEHEEYYRDTESIVDVAILRSYASLAYNSYQTYLSTVLFEQALIQAKVPFDIIFDQHLSDLSRWKVLVLANVESLSEEQLELIRKYVKEGGGLVATDDTSLYDQWRRRRPNYGLADLFEVNFIEDERERRAVHMPTKENTFGRGRAVYIPKVIPSKQPEKPDAFTYRRIGNNYWKLPLNWRELIKEVEWASGNNLSIKVNAPLTVTMELLQQRLQKRILLHLINYDVYRPVKNVDVELRTCPREEVERILTFSPDADTAERIEFTRTEGKIAFTVPTLEIYDLIPIDFMH